MEAVRDRRIILVYWKKRIENKMEVFSNLRNFCAHYPAYSYNTLNNYLGKKRTAFENEDVTVERKNVIGPLPIPKRRSMELVVRKGPMKEVAEEKEDISYWQSRPASERIAAVTLLVFGGKAGSAGIDKTIINKRKLHQ
ncbi:hypothetical protein GCM10023093_27100 [Nemorincola caseinilytica]|uniref:Uncharacterized protein n=1 Tax=Nemorincola caseinilytica TaxID=2054315 RepID=A0ABP8NNM5_9BACT